MNRYSEPRGNAAARSMKLLSELDGPSVPLSLPLDKVLAPVESSSFFKRFFKIMRISGTWSLKIMFYLVATAGISGLSAYLTNLQSAWGGLANKAVASRDFAGFWAMLGWFVFLGISNTLASNVVRLLNYLLNWNWKYNITMAMTDLYLTKETPFHVIFHRQTKIDNPDQRLASDIGDFASPLAELVTGVTLNVITIAILTIGNDWMIILLSYGSVLFASAFFCVCVWKLANYSFIQDQLEGNYRFCHSRIREYAESISFFKGELSEKVRTNRYLYALLQNQRVLSMWNMFMTMAQFMILQFPAPFVLAFLWRLFITHLLVSLANWNTNIAPEDYIATIDRAARIIGSVFQVAQSGGALSTLIGATNRVGQLLELCENINANYASFMPYQEYEEDRIEARNVTLTTPQNVVLVSDLSFKMEENQSILIMGPSGIGKSSLLRSLAGFWSCEGVITRPRMASASGILFLPQKPYFCKGTLKDQILFPFSSTEEDQRGTNLMEDIGNDELILDACRLARVAGVVARHGLNSRQAWSTVLSPGEQQRLGMARLYYHRPRFGVLDEATSAVEEAIEEVLYNNAKALGITLLSVGHRATLRKYHDTLLLFDGHGGYKLSEIDKINVSPEAKIQLEKRANAVETSQQAVEENPTAKEQKVEEVVSQHSYLVMVYRMILVWHSALWSRETVFALYMLCLPIVVNFSVTYALSNAMPLCIRDVWGFVNALIFYFIAVLVNIIGFGLQNNTAAFLSIVYRENFTHFLHNRYFSNRTILQLNSINKDVDNVDQRITNDLRETTSLLPNMVGGLAMNIIGIAINIVSAWKAFGGYQLVGLMFAAVLPITILSPFLLNLLAKYTYQASQASGDYRFSHITIREYVDTLAFYSRYGFEREKLTLIKEFNVAMAAEWRVKICDLIFWTAFQLTDSLLHRSIGLAIIAYSFQVTNFDPGNDGMSHVMTLMGIIGMFSVGYTWFVVIFPNIGKNKGAMTRVYQVMESIQQLSSEEAFDNRGDALQKIPDTGPVLSVRDLAVTTPTGRVLLQNLSLDVLAQDRILIMGPSGCGKSSFFRVMCGLWPVANGSVAVPEGIFFLPQKPYLVLGTLQDQVLYPLESTHERSRDTDAIVKLLYFVNLGYLLDRYALDSEEVWNIVLSPGEQQRLAFARLFFHRPQLAFLDECTSALDADNEAQMYQSLLELMIPFISIAHKNTLLTYHNLVLRLDGQGGYVLDRT